jgi:hypothetical protein
MDRQPAGSMQSQIATAGQITTAGAYVLLDGRFVFMVGPTPRGDALAVVRLGGHREGGESPWACAVREVFEEASLQISPLVPPATYWFQAGREAETPRPGPPPEQPEDAPVPLLIVQGAGQCDEQLSAMYLANATGEAWPAAEARGLLLLSPTEIVRLICARVTLDEYRRAGGRAVLLDDLPGDLPLDPYLQLRVLAVLLLRYPDLGGALAAPASAGPYRA